MRFDILTIFPEMFSSHLGASLLGKAQERGLLDVGLHDLREFAKGRHRSVDDTPYGGGGGMVMAPPPLVSAIEALRERHAPERLIVMTPAGRLFNQRVAVELSGYERIAILCGRYEGIDERVIEEYADDALSIGDYVLSGGEVAAMVVIEAVSRLIPGVLGNELGAWEDSHSDGALEFPQYTRPREFRGHTVPDVLLSGDHARIERWRRKESLRRTRARRPDLFARLALDEGDDALVRELDAES